MNKKVSVVVPIYNGEKYLKRCINSILAQTLQDFELILVNDGCTDSSSAIIESYKQIDKRVLVVNKENGGVSSARNSGLDYASGEYILFVDCDDYIAKSMLEKMVASLERDNADICVCNAKRINNGIVTTQSHMDDYCLRLNTKSDVEKYIQDYIFTERHKYCVWNKLYKLSMLKKHHIRFAINNDIYPEDLLFVLETSLIVKCITWIEEPLYFHILHTGGLTLSYRKNVINRYMNLCQLFKQKVYTDCLNNYSEECFQYVVQIVFFTAIAASINVNKANRIQVIKDINIAKKRNFFRYCMKYHPHDEKNLLRFITRKLLSMGETKIASYIIYYVVKKKKFKKTFVINL